MARGCGMCEGSHAHLPPSSFSRTRESIPCGDGEGCALFGVSRQRTTGVHLSIGCAGRAGLFPLLRVVRIRRRYLVENGVSGSEDVFPTQLAPNHYGVHARTVLGKHVTYVGRNGEIQA